MAGDRTRFTAGLRHVLYAGDGSRLRPTWRVVLAVPLLWLLTGGVLTGNLQAGLAVLPDGGEPGGGLVQSLLHAGFFLVALVVWARYLDRQHLSAYGVAVSRDWAREFLVGFVAVLLGLAGWAWLGAGLGGTTVAVAPSAPDGPVLAWLLLPAVSLLLHAAVQQVVFFRVILGAAAEGLHGRGLGARRAVLGAVPVAVVWFVLIHELTTPLRVLDLAVAGGIFGLLALHTGAVAAGIGAHLGALFGGTLVSAVLRVSGSLAGPLGVLDRYGFPKLVVAYLVVLAWLRWRRGAVALHDGIARRAGD